jgi:CCR4-NOT transcription complex subunit 7/8
MNVQVERIGPQHQAGSDSLLTGRAFFKMQEIYFEDELDDSKVYFDIHFGMLYSKY